jgi:putative flippase GtrA
MAQLFRQFLLFASVGAIGTAAHYVVLIALVESRLQLAPPMASGAGFAVGAFINYLLNYRFTFASELSHARTAPRFATIAVLGAVLNTLIMAAGTALLPVHYLVCQIIATACVLVFGYLSNRFWTFAVTRSTGSLP